MCLQQRVEKVFDRDRRLLLESLPEFLALEHLLRGEARREVDHVLQPEPPEPLGLEDDARSLARHDEVELLDVGLGVPHDLVVRHRRSRLILVGGIADLRRPVADDQHDLVTPLSELSHLAQRDGMAQMQVRMRRVEALFDTQLTVPGAQAGGEVFADDHLGHPTGQELFELGVAGARRHYAEDIGRRRGLTMEPSRAIRHATTLSGADRIASCGAGVGAAFAAGSRSCPRS